MTIKRLTILVASILLLSAISCSTIQKPDRKFDVSVKDSQKALQSPKVLYDEGHLNTHTANGTYKPFIDLIINYGCQVNINKDLFSIPVLNDYDLLIICNAKSAKDKPRDIGAFTVEECQAINKWVSSGGALLLIADHHPFGLANKSLAKSFGVEMGCGTVKELSHRKKQLISTIEFNRTNGLLGHHVITEGQNAGEKVKTVITFTGQSLQGDKQSTSLLNFGKYAIESRPDSVFNHGGNHLVRFAKPVSVENLTQALAIDYGKGRVVILGDAAMLSAQKLWGRKFGMNHPKSDNKQFAINIVSWLARK